MKDAVAHKRCNSAEPADRKADFGGAALAHPTIRGMGHVHRKSQRIAFVKVVVDASVGFSPSHGDLLWTGRKAARIRVALAVVVDKAVANSRF
jgi:hypothetical protein